MLGKLAAVYRRERGQREVVYSTREEIAIGMASSR